MTPPFAGPPESAVGVGGFASFGGDEMEGADAERGGFLEDFSRGLWARKTDQHCEGWQERRCFAPGEREKEGVRQDGVEHGFAAWAVDEADVEHVARVPVQYFEHVKGARIGAREWRDDFGRIEEDEIQ